MESTHRYPTLPEAIEIVDRCITTREKSAQLRFMAETQGRDFAEKVKDRVIEGRKGKSK